jgi:hypothetical protein
VRKVRNLLGRLRRRVVRWFEGEKLIKRETKMHRKESEYKLVMNKIVEMFLNRGYRVMEEEIASGVRPDIVVQAPEGQTFAIEVEVGPSGEYVPFSTAAQLRAYQRRLASYGRGEEIILVLFTNEDVPELALPLFKEARIPIVRITEDLNEMFDNMSAQIRNLGMSKC